MPSRSVTRPTMQSLARKAGMATIGVLCGGFTDPCCAGPDASKSFAGPPHCLPIATSNTHRRLARFFVSSRQSALSFSNLKVPDVLENVS